MNRTQLSAEEFDWLEAVFTFMPPIQDQLPLRFPTGQEIESLNFQCGSCQQKLKQVCGSVHQSADHSFLVEASGHCSTCDVMNGFSLHLRLKNATLKMNNFNPKITEHRLACH